jgi:transcriptional regulator GlxA family with amidase domain
LPLKVKTATSKLSGSRVKFEERPTMTEPQRTTAPGATRRRPVTGDPLRIGIALFPDAEELDWAGPWEVLAYWATSSPDAHVEVFTVAQQALPVRCARGLRVIPDHTWETAPPIDVLVYPGGRGTRPQLENETILEWLRTLARRGTLMTSVCTGSLVFAAAGLLDGLSATTHWDSTEDLGQLGHGINVRPKDRFVDSGEVITSAGVSAGIDMALHLVARLHSVERARTVRHRLQYDPEPPV